MEDVGFFVIYSLVITQIFKLINLVTVMKSKFRLFKTKLFCKIISCRNLSKKNDSKMYLTFLKIIFYIIYFIQNKENKAQFKLIFHFCINVIFWFECFSVNTTQTKVEYTK